MSTKLRLLYGLRPIKISGGVNIGNYYRKGEVVNEKYPPHLTE